MPALIEKKRADQGEFGTFDVMYLVSDDLPKADLVMVRDCFIHLPHAVVKKAIENVKRSGSRYLLTTTSPGRVDNIDIELGGFRPVDLQATPYDLPPPLEVILKTEGATNGKSIGI